MLASKDFGFMLSQGLITMLLQMFLLKTWCTSLSDIFATFTLRLGSYAVVSLARAALGFGALGRTLRNEKSIFEGGTINGAATSKPRIPA